MVVGNGISLVLGPPTPPLDRSRPQTASCRTRDSQRAPPGHGAWDHREKLSVPGGRARRGRSALLHQPMPSGRRRAEGAQELVAEGVDGLEEGAGALQQPVLPVPGGNLVEHRGSRDTIEIGTPRAAPGPLTAVWSMVASRISTR